MHLQGVHVLIHGRQAGECDHAACRAHLGNARRPQALGRALRCLARVAVRGVGLAGTRGGGSSVVHEGRHDVCEWRLVEWRVGVQCACVLVCVCMCVLVCWCAAVWEGGPRSHTHASHTRTRTRNHLTQQQVQTQNDDSNDALTPRHIQHYVARAPGTRRRPGALS